MSAAYVMGLCFVTLRSAAAARQPTRPCPGAHYQRICGMRYADGSEMDFSPAGIQRIAAEKAAYEAKVGHPVHDFLLVH